MSIGDSKQIVLERWGQNTTDTGVQEDVMLNRYRLWAEVKRLSERKGYDQQIDMKAGYSFKIWFNSDINPDGLWKVVYDGAKYNIHTIEKIREKRFNRLLKTEGNVS